jgi:hypothetical protein
MSVSRGWAGVSGASQTCSAAPSGAIYGLRPPSSRACSGSRPDLALPRHFLSRPPTLQQIPRRRAESMASAIIGQDEGAPGSLLGWDIDVTDHAGRAVLMVPISDLQRKMKQKRAA